MTLPYERTNSVIAAKKFLLRLCDAKVTPNVPKVIREHARMILRHYPDEYHLRFVARGWNNELVKMTCECPFSEPPKETQHEW